MAPQESKEWKGQQAEKLGIGELIEFDDVIVKKVATEFGVSDLVSFAKGDKVTRKCFAQGGMMEWLDSHPKARSIVLKKKVKDGDLTYNVWAES